MKTLVTILGQEPKKSKKKPIEFIKECTYQNWVEANANPSDWENIELIALDYTDGLDLMFAYYDDDRSGGNLYLGHFNDGVVE